MALIAITLPAQSALTVVPVASAPMDVIAHASLAIGLLGMALTLFVVFKSKLAGKSHSMHKARQKIRPD